jgi:DNA-binding NtrC family response regulator
MDSCDHQSSVNVAIIDDNEDVLDAVRLVLEDHGWCARAYPTGEAFIADLNHNHADCVMLTKPVTDEALASHVRAAIGNSSATNE